MAETCQVCGSTDIEDYVKHDEGHYLKCRACQLVYNADAERLAAQAVEKYDEASYFKGYASRLPEKIAGARRRMDLIQSFVPSGRLLDIGCSIGDSLIAARDAGFEAVGLDVGEYPVEHCGGLGFEVHQASISATSLPDESFDVVTMWDVIEHIPRTIDGLREVSRILKPGGVAALLTPTSEYIKAHLKRDTYQNYRAGWARTHFVYHTRQTMARVLRDCGLDPQGLPVVHAGALKQGPGAAAGELLICLPRHLLRGTRTALHLTRNMFVVARKVPARGQ